MINQITTTYFLTEDEENLLDSLKPFQAGVWDDGRVKKIKKSIHNQLLEIQKNKCCYCGLNVNEGGRAEIEHIAKKGGKNRPAYIEFVFTKKNLAIACQFCNSSSKKGQLDVLDFIDRTNYENCTFKIVHPYLDNPALHYKWTKGKYKILVSSDTDKGKYSIRLFDLSSEAHTLARAKQVMFEKKLSRYEKRREIAQRIFDIFKFKE